jgi:hypothetical protein
MTKEVNIKYYRGKKTESRHLIREFFHPVMIGLEGLLRGS